MTEKVPPALLAKGLKKHFGSIHAVDGIDLEISQGAAFGLIGQNGAGKTTFIKLMLSIARPTEGELSIFGGKPSDPNLRRRIGYLPERLNLPPAFTPIAFLHSVARLKRIPRSEADGAIPKVLRWVGLEEEAWERKTARFSKGMKQRTGLAAALLGEPDMLILDEPTDGIDPVGRAQIRKVIEEAHQRGATLFLNSHLLAETEKICTHVAIMNRGRVVLSGEMDSLRSTDSFNVVFDDEAGKSPDKSVVDKAAVHGFVPSEFVKPGGASFSYAGKNAADLSNSLKAALDDGLVLLEMSPAMRTLESVLEESVVRENANAKNNSGKNVGKNNAKAKSDGHDVKVDPSNGTDRSAA
ncbi:MAG: ABC transporter ATP-binding protein [Deltaproteobacteria bacterium]|nr:ABC transporter ATP-binding protein [Deltaproteobacteria bacterium]